MKVALCVCGVPEIHKWRNGKTYPTVIKQDLLKQQILNLTRYFPYADVFVHTWDWCEFPDDYPYPITKSEMIPLPCESHRNDQGIYTFNLEEYKFKGTKWEDYSWDKWFFQYKDFTGEKLWRFFNHWENLKGVDDSYDVIIKTSFEIFVKDFFWEELIKDCYKTGTTYGFWPASDYYGSDTDLNILKEYKWTKEKKRIYGHLIIHRKDKIKDPYQLLLSGDLLSSEKGWYKLLGDNYKNMYTEAIEHVRTQQKEPGRFSEFLL